MYPDCKTTLIKHKHMTVFSSQNCVHAYYCTVVHVVWVIPCQINQNPENWSRSPLRFG